MAEYPEENSIRLITVEFEEEDNTPPELKLTNEAWEYYLNIGGGSTENSFDNSIFSRTENKFIETCLNVDSPFQNVGMYSVHTFPEKYISYTSISSDATNQESLNFDMRTFIKDTYPTFIEFSANVKDIYDMVMSPPGEVYQNILNF